MSTYDAAGLQTTAIDAANAYGVPPSLFLWQIGQESGWNPGAYNASSGAAGLGQFIPSTAAARGVDTSDPVSSLYGAAAYDADLYRLTGDWGAALAKYGTVSSNSPASVQASANGVLGSLGSSVWGAASAAGSAVVSGITGGGSTSLGGGVSAALGALADTAIAGGEYVSGFSFSRIGGLLLGLICFAAGLYLLKPVQEVVNAGVKGAARAGEGAAL